MAGTIQISGGNGIYERLVSGLEREFGSGAAAALAGRFIDAESADFHWEARVRERKLGVYESLEEEEGSLERIAVLGRLGDRYFVAVLIIGNRREANALQQLRYFDELLDAEGAFATLH